MSKPGRPITIRTPKLELGLDLTETLPKGETVLYPALASMVLQTTMPQLVQIHDTFANTTNIIALDADSIGQMQERLAESFVLTVDSPPSLTHANGNLFTSLAELHKIFSQTVAAGGEMTKEAINALIIGQEETQDGFSAFMSDSASAPGPRHPSSGTKPAQVDKLRVEPQNGADTPTDNSGRDLQNNAIDAFSPNWAPPKLVKKLIAEIPSILTTLARWVAIPSVSATKETPTAPGAPFGAELRRALDTAAEDARSLGLDAFVDPEGYYAVAHIGNGSKRIIIPVHMDVVPPTGQPSEWLSGDPYKLLVQGGKVYGRGALDDKGPAAMATHVLSILNGAPLHPDTQIEVVYFTDEETGDWKSDVGKYIHDFGRPDIVLVPDAGFPGLIEDSDLVEITLTGQGAPLPIHRQGDIEVLSVSTGDNSSNMVPDVIEAEFAAPTEYELEKLKSHLERALGQSVVITPAKSIPEGRAKTHVTVKGVASHAAFTWRGKNALQMLAKALEGVTFIDTPPARAIVMIQDGFGYGWQGEKFGFATSPEDPQLINFTILKADQSGIEGVVDARCRPDTHWQEVEAAISGMAASFGVDSKTTSLFRAIPAPKDSPDLRILKEAVQRHLGPDLDFVRIKGATYARAFHETRNLALAFGIMLPGDPETDHQLNEFTPLETIKMAARIYLDALWGLAVDPTAVEPSAPNPSPRMKRSKK